MSSCVSLPVWRTCEYPCLIATVTYLVKWTSCPFALNCTRAQDLEIMIMVLFLMLQNTPLPRGRDSWHSSLVSLLSLVALISSLETWKQRNRKWCCLWNPRVKKQTKKSYVLTVATDLVRGRWKAMYAEFIFLGNNTIQEYTVRIRCFFWLCRSLGWWSLETLNFFSEV